MAMDRGYCHDCGAQNRAAAFYCRQCGARLDQGNPASGQPAGAAGPAQADGAAFAPVSQPAPDTAPLTPDNGSPGDRRTWAADTGPRSPRSRRPWALALLAVVAVLGAGALTGWQTQWPRAIFGAQKTAVIKPAPPSRSPGPPPATEPTTMPAAGPASPPGSSAPQGPDSGSASAAAGDPASVVDAYFAAINAHDYQRAWALGGSNSGASSYEEFVAGFGETRSDTVTILATSGDVVTAQLVAQQDDGSVKTFAGTYTVTGGVITVFHVKQTG
jgi:hypothetical protein